MSNDVYNEPGKCRKQCPQCKKYIHARSLFCRGCNFEFIPGSLAKFNKKQENNVDTYEEGGRGKKQCDKCQKFVGARISQCVCGYDFTSAPKKDTTKVVDEEVRKYAAALGVPNYRVILAPIGPHGKKPKSTNKEDILSWIDDTLFSDRDSILYISALKYRLRQIYGFNTEDYNNAAKTLLSWYNEIQKT